MVANPRWPIEIYGQDLNRAIPAAIQPVGGYNVFVPSLNRMPDNGFSFDGVERIITANATITSVDSLLLLNRATVGTLALQLPLVSSRNGLPLIIVDIAGNADTTLTRAGSDTIMGLTTASLQSSAQGLGPAAFVILQPISSISMWVQAG